MAKDGRKRNKAAARSFVIIGHGAGRHRDLVQRHERCQTRRSECSIAPAVSSSAVNSTSTLAMSLHLKLRPLLRRSAATNRSHITHPGVMTMAG